MHEYIGLLGVVLGWLLNEASRWIWAGRDEKKAIALALAALLEIRHRVRAIPTALKWLSDRANLPPDAEVPIKLILSRWFPADQGLLRRYSDAVALVATQNPILGFRLNHQDLVLPWIDRLREFASQDTDAATVLSKVEPEVIRTLSAHLEELIRALARQHGWWTRFRVWCHLRKGFEIPTVMFQLLEHLPPHPGAAQQTPVGHSDTSVGSNSQRRDNPRSPASGS